jgi:hypothetical protein
MDTKTFGGIVLTLVGITGLILLPSSILGGSALLAISIGISYIILRKENKL